MQYIPMCICLKLTFILDNRALYRLLIGNYLVTHFPDRVQFKIVFYLQLISTNHISLQVISEDAFKVNSPYL